MNTATVSSFYSDLYESVMTQNKVHSVRVQSAREVGVFPGNARWRAAGGALL